ncbi:MAG: hypothetical protein R3F61_23070 [Myxococcota bacterium]
MVLLASLAWSNECASPLTAAELEALVQAASTAVGNDDVAGFRARYRELGKRVPCLEGPIPTKPWAEMLVLDAIVRFADGQEAGVPLGTARSIDPGVEVPPFLADVAPIAPDGGEPIAAGVELYVDGVRAERLGPLQGDHVLQRSRGGRWESVLGSSIPRSWSSESSARIPTTPADRWVIASIGPGFTWVSQKPDEPGDYLPEASGVGAGAQVSGEARFAFEQAGAFARVVLPLWIGRLSGGGLRFSPSGDLGVSRAAGPIEVELGVHVAFTPLLEGGKNKERLDLLPALGARWVGDAGDAGLTVGAWLDSVRVVGRGGWSIEAGESRIRVGAEVGAHTRGFEQQLPARVRPLHQTTFEAGLSVGMVVP